MNPSKRKAKTPEQKFLETYDAGEFEHPSLAVDVALLSVRDGELIVALVRRDEYPDKGKWALPGGFVGFDEPLDTAASRILSDKAGQRNVFLEQLFTFGDPARDPRTRVVTVAYYALVDAGKLAGLVDREVLLGRLHVAWPGETGGTVGVLDADSRGLEVAFDHCHIIGMAVQRIRGKLNYAPIGFQLLPKTFTLRRLQDIHQAILGTRLNKDSFRRRMLASGQLEPTGKLEAAVVHRPAELYRFTKRSAV